MLFVTLITRECDHDQAKKNFTLIKRTQSYALSNNENENWSFKALPNSAEWVRAKFSIGEIGIDIEI